MEERERRQGLLGTFQGARGLCQAQRSEFRVFGLDIPSSATLLVFTSDSDRIAFRYEGFAQVQFRARPDPQC